jgi:uncharacterized membrane protein
MGSYKVQNYRLEIKKHFENIPFIQNLLSMDYIFSGLGILFLFFHEFNIVITNSDIFMVLGFWLFLFGIGLSFIKKNDIGLTVGLGLYAVIYLVKFIQACISSGSYYYGYGFYGYSALGNLIVSISFTILAVRASEYFIRWSQHRRDSLMLLQNAAMPMETIHCSKCNAVIKQSSIFCSKCGHKNIELTRCKHCSSPLAANTKFCTRCGNKA